MKQLNLRSRFYACLNSALIIFALSGVVTPSAASAQSSASGRRFYIDTTFFPVLVNQNDTTQADLAFDYKAENGLGIDFRTTFGYTFWDRLVVGLSYNYYKLTTKLPAGTFEGETETLAKSEWGPTLAFLWGQTHFALTYFMSGERQIDRKGTDAAGATTSDVTFKNKDMSGFQFAAGYTFQVWGAWEIGPSLVYRTVSYKKQTKTNRLNSSEDYSGTLSYKAVEAHLNPMITFLFRF